MRVIGESANAHRARTFSLEGAARNKRRSGAIS